jgi:hypothetical protein
MDTIEVTLHVSEKPTNEELRLEVVKANLVGPRGRECRIWMSRAAQNWQSPGYTA